MSLMSETVLSRYGHLVIRAEDGVLFDTRKNTIIECNETGFQVLMLLDGKRSVEEIAAGLAKEYDAPLDELRECCLEFLETSLKDGLVHVAVEEGAAE